MTRHLKLMVAAGTSSSSETQWDRSVGRGKRRDESFQAQAEKPLGTDSHRTISKWSWSSECWLLIGYKKCFVLLCPIGEQHLLSSSREFVHYGLLSHHICQVRSPSFPNQRRRNYLSVENRLDGTSRSNSDCTKKILFLMDQLIGCLRCSGDEKVKRQWLDKGKQRLCTRITLFCTFLCRHCTTTTWKCLISRLVKDLNKQWENFLSLELGYMVDGNSPPEGFTCIWQSIKRVGIITIKTEKMWIHFSCHVFVAS